MSTNITIKFDSEEVAREFAMWLCESGEQQYWNWLDYSEGNPLIVTHFEYHSIKDDAKDEDDPERYGEFMGDWTIRTKLGRLHKEDEEL